MRITYDPFALAAYIYLTDAELEPERDTIEVETPPGVGGSVLIDWKDGKMVGIEVLNAPNVLHRDLIDSAD